MVTFGGKNGLANFRRSELQNSATHKNKFPTLFQEECHIRVVFSCFHGGRGVEWGGVLNRGSTSSRVTQYCVHNICRFT